MLDVDVFTVLAEPTRRAVLDLLADGERTAGDLASAAPGLTQPAVSRHLRVLREAGLVQVRAAGQHRVYRLDARPLSDVEQWLSRYRRHWSGALDRLTENLTNEAANNLVAVSPLADGPVADGPDAEDPVAEDSVAEDSVAGDPLAENLAAEQPGAGDLAAQQLDTQQLDTQGRAARLRGTPPHNRKEPRHE